MAESDILNPVQGYWTALGGNPTWDYDYDRKKANNKLEQTPRLGPGISRDVSNDGHTFTWNWNARPLAVVQRLEKFYQDFKQGYFTIIDYDNGSRHHVGRFTDTPRVKQIGHLSFSVQALTFAEVKTARMLVYPSDWVNWGHQLNVVDDFFPGGSPAPTVAFMQGAWTLEQGMFYTTSSTPLTDPTSYGGLIVAPNAGDWAQMQYTGWGFQMTFPLSNSNGVVNLYLDGVEIVTGLDLSTGACTSSVAAVALAVVVLPSVITRHINGVQVTMTNVPLDIHRVKVQVAGAGSATMSTGGGTNAVFPPLTYIY